MTEKTVWVRPATGLVKTFSTFDAWLLNVWTGAPLLLPIWMFTIPAFYPGGDFLVGGLIVIPLAALTAGVYSFLAGSMPRSGGDYVYVSRLIHPALGFATTVNLIFWVCFWVGPNIYVSAKSLGDLGSDLGFVAFQSWCYTPWGGFIVGTIGSIILVLLLIVAMGKYRYLQALIFGWGFLAIFGIAAIFFVLGPSFVANSQQAIGLSAQELIAKAGGSGFDPTPVMGQSFLPMMAVMWYALIIPFGSQYMGGEIKSANSIKMQLKTMVLGCITIGLCVALLYAAIEYGIGKDYYNALIWLFYVDPSKYPATMLPPWPWNMAKLVSGMNLGVRLFVDIPVVLTSWFLNAINYLIFSRIFFAYAWDRLVPTKLASVNSRWHTPVYAIIVTFIIAEIFLAFFTFGENLPWLADFLGAGTGGVMATFLLTSLLATVIPYARKDFYNASPMKKYELGGVPVITILGILSSITLSVMMYQYANLAFLKIQWLVPTVVVLFVGSIIVYYILKAIRRSQGIDVTLAYKEIPSA